MFSIAQIGYFTVSKLLHYVFRDKSVSLAVTDPKIAMKGQVTT